MAEDLTGAFELLQVLPRIGLGAFSLDSVDLSVQRLSEFFIHGGKLIEISELFSNYQYVGPALANAQLTRKDIFILLRVWPQQQTPGALQERIVKFLHVSNFEYIDILMAHAPIDINNRFEQWTALENIKKAGLAKTLGLANLSLNQIMTVIKNANILPAFCATEVSPFHQQTDLIDYCNAGSISVINFEPCCKGIRNRFPKLMELCEPLSASPEQVRRDSLVFFRQRRCCVHRICLYAVPLR